MNWYIVYGQKRDAFLLDNLWCEFNEKQNARILLAKMIMSLTIKISTTNLSSSNCLIFQGNYQLN